MVSKTKIIKQTIVLAAKPEEVYDALIDAKKHSAFTEAKATCNPKVGGKFTAWDGYIFGKNLVLEKGKTIVQEWMTSEWPEGYPPSIVEFSLKKKDKGTQLTMLHKKVPGEQADFYKQGWIDYYWEPLKEYLKHK